MEYEPHSTLTPKPLGGFTEVRKISLGYGLIEFTSIPDDEDKCDWIVTRISAATYKFYQH